MANLAIGSSSISSVLLCSPGTPITSFVTVLHVTFNYVFSLCASGGIISTDFFFNSLFFYLDVSSPLLGLSDFFFQILYFSVLEHSF